MNSIRNATLTVAALALGLALGAVPEEVLAARACPNIPGTPKKKCIKKADILPGAVNESRLKDGAVTGLKLGDGAVTETKLSEGVQNHVNQRESYYTTLELDMATATVAVHGPLKYFVRCRINDVGEDKLQMVATSSEGPWYSESSPTTVRAAFEEVQFIDESVTTTMPRYDEGDSGDHTMIGPGGYVMSLLSEASGFGLNIYGHRCTAVGHVLKIRDPNAAP